MPYVKPDSAKPTLLTGSEDIQSNRLSTWLMGWPIVCLLSLVYVIHILFWFPQRLMLPLWCDHDVFDVMARGWQQGVLPYRDLFGNNFPGSIYIFWILGRLFGWEKTSPIYIFDFLLFLSFLGVLVAWSRARLGRSLPGIVACGIAIGIYFNFMFYQAAQRDGQAALFAMGGLLLAQTWHTKTGFAVSALLLACGTMIRPQVLLLCPAYWMTIISAIPQDRKSLRKSILSLTGWSCLLGALFLCGLIPLALSGILGNFLQSLKAVAYGSSYNSSGIRELLPRMTYQFVTIQHVVVFPIAAILLCRKTFDRQERILLSTWTLALSLLWFYGPLSPVQHEYTLQPVLLIMPIFAALLTQAMLKIPKLSSSWQLLFVLLILSTVLEIRPRYISVGNLKDAIRVITKGEVPELEPYGYKLSELDQMMLAPYPLSDYWKTIEHVRATTSPDTRIVSVIRRFGIAGPCNRLSALPAESFNWVRVVKESDLPLFVKRLEESVDSVVVWDPEDPGQTSARQRLSPFYDAVYRLYRPSAKFGRIEVWTRKTTLP